MKIKAKVHAVTYAGKTYLVMAQTKQGAARDLLAHIAGEIDSQVATGEQLYAAGVAGDPILFEGAYKQAVDPAQADLPLPELTAAQGAGDTDREAPAYTRTGANSDGE